jgi:hypothetical protein
MRATGKRGDSLDGTTRRANYSLIEALVLAKAIVLGNALGIGDHFRNRPLIVSTFCKRLCFGILMLGFSVLENLIAGWWCGKNYGAVLQSNLGEGLAELLTRVLE